MALKISNWMVYPAAVLITSAAALAQEPGANTIHERKENQQERIGEGVENGSLTAGEAARLEKREAGINQEIAAERTANGGKLTPAERAKIDRQQDRLSQDIHQQKHDAQAQHYGDNEVDQRRENQQERIGEGIESGKMTADEAARAERQETQIKREVHQDRAANGGTLTPHEKAKVNREQHRASRSIYNKKHNANTRRGAK